MPDTGAALIAAERQRQIAEEGYTPEHDDEHANQEMLDAARCYLSAALFGQIFKSPVSLQDLETVAFWPWDPSYWKSSKDPVRDLVKAGALIAAEIDRLQRKAEAEFDG